MAGPQPPRPNQNSNGQAKQPSANPTGAASQGQPPVAPSMTPGQMQVGQLAGQMNGAPGVPNTPGAGVPEALQSFPQDAGAFMQLMQSGYSPGADPMQHGMAQNAHAIARAQEQAAAQQSQELIAEQSNQQALAALLQKLMLAGQAPDPAAVAGQVAQQQFAPQLQGAPQAPQQAPPAY